MSRLRRRQVVQGVGAVGLGLVVGCGRWPGQGQAPVRVPRVAFLSLSPQPFHDAFREGLADLGYIEGQNVILEWRAAAGNRERLAEEVAELIRLPVQVLVAASSPATEVANQLTGTIPIVTVISDPIALGLAASLARPGGNVTGLTNYSTVLSKKRLELLKDSVPAISRVAVLWDAANPGKMLEWNETQAAAHTLGVELVSLELRTTEDLDSAFATAIRERVDALLALGDGITSTNRARIVDFAVQSRLPAMYTSKIQTDAGGLMAYGANLSALSRRAAYYVDRILKGAKPADLPIELPMRFDFVLNLKMAQALGLTIPQHVLLQATEVIQ
jgi:putative tryptophan/tyrosine transport system substrate-binding protein